jgi:hypothetical protein
LDRCLRNHRCAYPNDKTNSLESGQVNKFRRWPSDLVKYFAFKEKMLQTYPTIEKFILAEKLNWPDPPVAHSAVPYADPRIHLSFHDLIAGDYQIRLNDHPYAFGPEITHIVVWSASRFPAEVATQERMVCYEKFVEEHFGEISSDNRRWFLNWGSIQSVPGLEVEFLEKF